MRRQGREGQWPSGFAYRQGRRALNNFSEEEDDGGILNGGGSHLYLLRRRISESIG
jgi:hypothetical protein